MDTSIDTMLFQPVHIVSHSLNLFLSLPSRLFLMKFIQAGINIMFSAYSLMVFFLVVRLIQMKNILRCILTVDMNHFACLDKPSPLNILDNSDVYGNLSGRALGSGIHSRTAFKMQIKIRQHTQSSFALANQFSITTIHFQLFRCCCHG